MIRVGSLSLYDCRCGRVFEHMSLLRWHELVECSGGLSERDGAGIGRDSVGEAADRTKPKTAAPRSESPSFRVHRLSPQSPVRVTL